MKFRCYGRADVICEVSVEAESEEKALRLAALRFVGLEHIGTNTMRVVGDGEIFLGNCPRFTTAQSEDQDYTKMEFLYRDASNYKLWNTVYFRGQITDEQKKAILACRIDGAYFIPEDVGIPAVKYRGTEDDTDFCEIYDHAFSTFNGELQPTCNLLGISLDGLVAQFQAAHKKWEGDYHA